MLNKDMHLIDDLSNPELVPTRNGFGEGLVEAGKLDPRVVAMCADLTESTRMLPFKEAFPDRFIQSGISEQFLVAGGAGMALSGKVPFVASYAMFCPGRAWEQVRTLMGLNETNVKIAGAHAGVSVGPDGATHQAVEDIAIMRVIPNMTVVVPCDSVQTKKATLAVAAFEGPAYLRFGREKSAVFTTEDTPFEIGKAQVLREGGDVAIVACGILVYNALMAAEELAKNGIEATVINNHTIKPMDEDTIVAAAEKCGAVVTVEEHQVSGGMGSAVAECLARRAPTPIEFIGVQDTYGQSGDPMELVEHYGMGVSHIVEAAKKAHSRKK